MATIANITITDGKATPANHVFSAIKSGLASLWRTTVSSLPLVGQEIARLVFKDASPTVRNVVLSLDLPALESATGSNESGYTAAPKVAYTNRVTCSFMLPDRGLADQRKDLRVLLRNLLNDPQVVDAIDNLIPPN